MSSRTTDAYFKKLIAREAPGEIILWMGHPDAKLAFRAGFLSYIMAVPWLAVSLPVFGGMAGAFLGGPAKRAVPLWEKALAGFGLVFTFSFVAIGIAMLATPFWARGKARRTVYAITDRRVLSIVDGKTITVSSLDPARIQKIERTEKRDGSGTLKFVIGCHKDSEGDTVQTAETFYAVQRVRQAERIVGEIMHRASAAQAV